MQLALFWQEPSGRGLCQPASKQNRRIRPSLADRVCHGNVGLERIALGAVAAREWLQSSMVLIVEEFPEHLPRAIDLPDDASGGEIPKLKNQ
ncbi:MAG TPA: hypothetical protein VGX70_20405, partial [Gemmataceae bacterium]|nr:hypothetical protein [Gemmataceae bacterium]